MDSTNTKSSGVLLHVTSLPQRLTKSDSVGFDYRVGDLGDAAFEFVDFLKSANQSIWQMLPICPTCVGDSPYSSYSAFAGNALLISIDQLVRDGWLATSTVEAYHESASANGSANGFPHRSDSYVNFQYARQHKTALLKKAFLQSYERLATHADFQSFITKSDWWLRDFSLFESLMHHHGHTNWTRWPTPIAQRTPDAILECQTELADEILFSKFVQFQFDRQWQNLKQYANTNGIKLLGDIPIFVGHESADVWANQHLFRLDPSGNCTVVAGVPPDYFSETGQLWGNPLYDWSALHAEDYAWWTARFRRSLEQFDLMRLDHFRGFEAFWEVPAGAATAASGQWQQGPLDSPFEAARTAIGRLPIIAEDLGLITQPVHDLRERLGFPTMRVLQFGFDEQSDNLHHPCQYPENCVAYTGTHDNETLMGWYESRREAAIKNHQADTLLETQLSCEEEIHWQLIELLLESAAQMTIVPMQDLLGLDNQARMNVPGQAQGNWDWRLRSNDISDGIAPQFALLTASTGRDLCLPP